MSAEADVVQQKRGRGRPRKVVVVVAEPELPVATEVGAEVVVDTEAPAAPAKKRKTATATANAKAKANLKETKKAGKKIVEDAVVVVAEQKEVAKRGRPRKVKSEVEAVVVDGAPPSAAPPKITPQRRSQTTTKCARSLAPAAAIVAEAAAKRKAKTTKSKVLDELAKVNPKPFDRKAASAPEPLSTSLPSTEPTDSKPAETIETALAQTHPQAFTPTLSSSAAGHPPSAIHLSTSTSTARTTTRTTTTTAPTTTPPTMPSPKTNTNTTPPTGPRHLPALPPHRAPQNPSKPAAPPPKPKPAFPTLGPISWRRSTKWQPVQEMPQTYKPAARRITAAICALPIAIVTGMVLYERLVLGKEKKITPHEAVALEKEAAEKAARREGGERSDWSGR